jgi:hypothetical protein
MRQRSVLNVRLTCIVSTLIAVAAITLGPTSMANASSKNAAVGPATTQADSDGVFISATPDGTFPPNIPKTSRNGLCTGEWLNGISTVFYRRGTSGRLYWDFYLTKTAIAKLGPEVIVDMTSASVNGKAINPPYAPHRGSATYDFHASLLNYGMIGGGNGRIETGDNIDFIWFITGSTGAKAYRYTFCKVPEPGVG